MTNTAFHVQWFIQGDAISDVTVRIGDGRLIDVEPGLAADATDLGSVALIDGLVNAHTHLEFSSIPSPIPATGRFTDWIRAVVSYRREHPAGCADPIRAGIRECIESGTTLIGEIASANWYQDSELRSSFHGTIFQEILGLSAGQIGIQQELAHAILRSNLQTAGIGISPHAPYSTHLDLVEEAVRLSQQSGCPLAMHLAETRSELQLLQQGTGEFRELLQDFGLWREDLFPPGRRVLDYLKILSRAPRSLVIHGNYLDDDELSFLAAHPQMTLVYCPRTHAHFGHDEHPWLRASQLGVQIAIGTDSRASNPDLSLFEELKFLAEKHPNDSHLELLNAAAGAGRRALGINPSSAADFTLVQLGRNSCHLPNQELFSGEHRVCGTMIRGEWVWLSPEFRGLCQLRR